ncbi:MAG: hypothetical protein AB202_00045 [Parcubacteria bacterium C7867-007]|nr:MAG: hypothetical protein AB202_00045 [Parcubacteria bacterium C7867-007]
MTYTRSTGILLTLIAGLFLFAATTTQAQTCTPSCGTGMICVYEGSNGYTATCIKAAASDGTVDVIEVTATAKCSGKSLCALVNNTIIPIGNSIVGLLFAVAFLLFIYGMFKYFFLKGGDPKARSEGRMFMLWSIIAFAVMFSVWGLVNLIINIIPT